MDIVKKNRHMKRIFLSLLTVAALFACAPTDSYRIEGECKTVLDGGKVYLAELTYNSLNYIDSATISNGKFEFVGKQEQPAVRFLFYPHAEGGEDMLPIVLENGNIKVYLGKVSTVGGSQLNVAMQSYKNDFEDVVRRSETLFRSIDDPRTLSPEQRDSLQVVTNAIIKEMSDVLLRHIRINIDNPVGAFLISINGKMCDAEQLYPLMDSVPEAYRDERFNNFNRQMKEEVAQVVGAARTAEGGAYVNFELKDIGGTPVLFSSIVESNRYTLLDFWASWCAPCRNAMPGIKKIHEKYGNKGLAVVSLSIDTDAEAWKKAVAELGMTWTQLCNPDGGSREVGQAYGVEFIPTVLIIDKDGKIVSRGLEGEELAAKVDELMK